MADSTLMATPIARQHRPAACPISNSPFIFMSSFRSLYASGCFCRLSTAAADGAIPDGTFQQAVASAFRAARAAGIRAPILAGAIPFDSRQPASLMIPEQYQWLAREDCCQRLPPADQAPLPQVLHTEMLPEKAQFLAMVSNAASLCQSTIAKVVLARLVNVQCRHKVDSLALLARLAAQNPHSFNFHIPLADGGVLLGASPELLLRKTGRQFYSQPLAGSARRQPDASADKLAADTLLHSAKDRHEHQIVSQAIKQQLAPRSHQLQIPDTPEVIATPALWHLASAISGECASAQENALSLACLLHPTPALCGFPHEAARQLISQLEPFDRQLFGGIAGWCNEQGDGEWAVIIRSAYLHEQSARFFAGVGIVAASSPLAEWQETQGKLATMFNAFGFNLPDTEKR